MTSKRRTQLDTAYDNMERWAAQVEDAEARRNAEAREREQLLDALQRAAGYRGEPATFVAGWAPHWLHAVVEFRAKGPYPDPATLVEADDYQVALAIFRLTAENPTLPAVTELLEEAYRRARPPQGAPRPAFVMSLRDLLRELDRRLKEVWADEDEATTPHGAGTLPLALETALRARRLGSRLSKVRSVAERVAADSREYLGRADLERHGISPTTIRDATPEIPSTFSASGTVVYLREGVLDYLVHRWNPKVRGRRGVR